MSSRRKRAEREDEEEYKPSWERERGREYDTEKTMREERKQGVGQKGTEAQGTPSEGKMKMKGEEKGIKEENKGEK